MWNALRSDLKEFASSIATDGNAIRENIETKLVVDADTDTYTDTDYDAALQDNDYDNDQDQSNMNDMIIGENGEVEYMHKDDTNDSNNDSDTNDNGNDGEVKDEVIDEAIRRADDEETYLTPLLINEVNGVNGVIGIGSEESQNDEIVDADADADAAPSQEEDGEEEELGNSKNTEGDGGEEGWGDGQDPSFETVQEEEESAPSTAAAADDDPNTVQEQDIPNTDINNNTYDAPAEATTTDATTNIEIDRSAPSSSSSAPVPEQILIPIDPKDDPAIIAFLTTFTLQSKTQEIGEILADSPDTTCKHFDYLVPQFVSYEQFWQRYYYRCDPERIQREWEEEEVRERIRRMELIENGKKRVQDLFGGALKSIIKGAGSGGGDGIIRASGSDVKEESIYEKYQAELEEKRRAFQDGSGHSGEGGGTGVGIADEKERKIGGLGGIFGRVRPPFVMNTAVDDDDDEEEYEEDDAAQDENNRSDHDDDEEAEEDDDFGWGSDEDDEEDDDGVSNGSQEDGDSEGTEEVVFSSPDADTDTDTDPDKSGSPEMEMLRRELDKALKLKEELERTVERQEQQLKISVSALQLQEESSTPQEDVVATEDDSGGAAAAAAAEVERLELALFEKDSELAALKASREDADGEREERESEAMDELKVKVDGQEAEIIRLISELGKKEEQFDGLRENLKKAEALQDKEDATDNEMLAEALETINSLQADLEQCSADARQHLEEMENMYQDEMNGLREEITKLGAEQEGNAEQEKALKESTELIASLQSQLEATSDDLSIVQEEVVSLKVLHEERVFKDKDALAEAAENIASLQSELQDTKDKLVATAHAELEENTCILDELRDKNVIISALNSELEEVKAHLALKEDADEIDQDSLTDAREMISSLQLELERSYAEVASAKDATQVKIQQSIDAFQASEGNVASLQSKLEAAQAELDILLSTKDEESANGNAALDDTNKALAVLQSELEMAKAESTSLQDEMASKEAAVIEFEKAYTEANETIAVLNVKLEETKSAAESQISIARAQLEASTKESNDAEKLLEAEVKNLLAKVRIFESEKGNEARKVETSIQDLEDDKRIGETVASPLSPNEEGSSFSSGVDVHSPVRTDVKENGDEDEDGGWGEDWSDDEEV